mgnify:CR=1 FL=1
MSKIKLIAFDLDGTLTQHKTKLDPVNRAVLEKLAENYVWCEMERVDDHYRCVRFCTSWATREENVDALCTELRRLSGM